jgi:uncharacterized membrane protein
VGTLRTALNEQGESLRSGSRRLTFLDALRLLAALQMIQGHSLDAVLGEAYRTGALFDAWTFTRGLTSTAFLAASGLAFAAVGHDRDAFVRGRAHRMRRAAMLIAIGYLMHVPFGLLLGQPREEALRELFVVDVLQCIGVGLFVLEALAHGVGARIVRGVLALGIGASLFALAPWADRIEPSGSTRVLELYLSSRGGSIFPLIPWLGYMLIGYAVGLFALRQGVRTPPRAQIIGLAIASLLTLLVSVLHSLGPRDLPARLDPTLFWLRLSLVFAVSLALAVGLRHVRRLPPLLTRLAGETLFLYVSHVVVLYAAGVGLASRVGRTQPPGVGLLLALGLVVSCSAAALASRALSKALRRG